MNILKRRLPRTLFGRTALTLAIVLVVFQISTSLVIVHHLLLPVAKRSAEDFAELMTLSVQTWTKAPAAHRELFAQELYESTGVTLQPAATALPEHRIYLPYFGLLREALYQQTGYDVHVTSTDENYAGDVPRYWVDVGPEDQRVRISFPKARLDFQIPSALLLILVSATVFTVLAALILVRWLTSPLSELAEAATRVGRGTMPDPLPERGPEELATLARTFNQMALQVKTLIANRTTLLAGIAHDLRTPITRMRLALEMLDPGMDQALLGTMRRNFDNMTRLITQALEFGQGLENDAKQEVDLHEFMEEFAEETQISYDNIEWDLGPSCTRIISVLALRRILTNLVENAVRYGEGKPVHVSCTCNADRVLITVRDHGPGIPTEELDAVFQPFYRIEKSRNMATGGSGLGLAIAKQLADSNGWALSLHPHAGEGVEARMLI